MGQGRGKNMEGIINIRSLKNYLWGCVCVCERWGAVRRERWSDSPGTGVLSGDSKLPCGCWELSPVFLKGTKCS